MTVTLSSKTEALLQEMARLLDWDAEELADALLLEALETKSTAQANLSKRTGIL